jgi:hypothetical protein
LGRDSSPVEHIAELINGGPVTNGQVEWLRALMEERDIAIGARWTTPTGARDVTRRVQDHAREKDYPVPQDATILS